MFKFIKEVNAELRHVSWPTRNQAAGYTILVIIISIIIAAYLGAFDWVFTKLINLLIS
jgi:preprotein translocase subunit SecE